MIRREFIAALIFALGVLGAAATYREVARIDAAYARREAALDKVWEDRGHQSMDYEHNRLK